MIKMTKKTKWFNNNKEKFDATFNEWQILGFMIMLLQFFSSQASVISKQISVPGKNLGNKKLK